VVAAESETASGEFNNRASARAIEGVSVLRKRVGGEKEELAKAHKNEVATTAGCWLTTITITTMHAGM